MVNTDIVDFSDLDSIKSVLLLLRSSFFNQEINNSQIIDNLSDKFHRFGTFLVAKKGEEICGFSAFYSNDLITYTAFLSMIVVSSNYQGMGIGQLLLNKTIEICRENNMKHLSLEVDKNNNRAIHFYIKNGFVFLKQKTFKTLIYILDL